MLNNKKCFLIFAILIVLLFGLTIVGAADNTNATCDDTNILTSVADDTTNIEVTEETSNYENKEANSIKTTKKSIEKLNTTNTNTKTETSTTVTNYTELVNAVNSAKELNVNSYTISLLPGDYNATASMTWVMELVL